MKRIKNIAFASAIMLFALFIQEGFSQNTKFLAGIAKVDITPTENLYMGGYDESCRVGRSDGADGKIYIRALIFEDNIKKIAFVECDIVSISSKENDSIRISISKETDIPFENIMLACVHNHAAPSLDKQNSDAQWYRSFNDNVVKAVKNAMTDLEPVNIGGGFGKSVVGMNRRKKMEDTISYTTFDENNSSQSYGKYKTDNPVRIREMAGVCRLGVNPEGDIDDQVGIMRIDKLSGEPKAVFVNYACHGTSLGGRNNKISPEWNGNMLEYIEKTIPGITGIFAQGAAGDINPRFVGGLDGYKDNLENTVKLGYEIGKEVVDVFNKIKTDSPINSEIKIIHKNIVCPLKYGEVVKDFRHTTVDVPTSVVRIDDFEWVTFPGELFHQIGKVIKSSTHVRYPFFVGYCNGSVGYLPTQQAYSEGGYEPWSSRFDPVTEKIYVKEIAHLLIRLY
jgi:neutral ceramidase